MEALLGSARQRLRWWDGALPIVHELEHPSIDADRTISRLRPDEIEKQPLLRPMYEKAAGLPWDLLAWESHVTGPFGMYRLVAVFPERPEGRHEVIAVPSPATGSRPRVLCLDGPIVAEHRYDERELCLYYPNDPPERRWTLDQGLLGLFDMARAHVTAEYSLLTNPKLGWPLAEAPHGPTAPAPSDPRLRLPPLAARL